ncbi:MAG: hypothetical protein CUN48_18690, partial [Candidatus Thermofonsia Clade 3 bacterium]
NNGGPIDGTVQAEISVPNALTYLPQSLQATAGAVSDAAAPLLRWQGVLGAGQAVTVTYQTTLNSGASGVVTTVAQINAPNLSTLTRSAALVVRTSGGDVADPDFFLPGTQPAQMIDPIVDPTSCQ